MVLLGCDVCVLFEFLFRKQEVDLHLLLRSREHIDLVDADHVIEVLGEGLVVHNKENAQFVHALAGAVQNWLDVHLCGLESVEVVHHLGPVCTSVELGIL